MVLQDVLEMLDGLVHLTQQGEADSILAEVMVGMPLQQLGVFADRRFEWGRLDQEVG